jgi:hypothetical protein
VWLTAALVWRAWPQTGDWHRAGELHGAAQALLERTGRRREEPEACYRQESLAKVRAQLGHEQFDRVYAQGSTLNLEEAIDVIWRARSRMAPR